MKAGWKRKQISDVCEIVNGGTPKTGASEYWDGNHCWITPAEMGKRASPYIGDTERKITDLGLRNSSARKLPPKSVILSSRAPIGHLVVNTVSMATNQGCKGLVPRSEIQYKYLYYYLNSIVGLLNDLGTGTTFKELSGSKLREVPVPVAPIPEQKRIVSILDNAFEGIATTKANTEKNLQNARALFESYLRSIFLAAPSDWASSTIGEHIKFVDYRGKTPNKTEVGIRLITAKNVKKGYLQLTPEEFVAEDSYEDWMTRGIPKKGDVLFTTEAPLANVAQIDTEERVVVGQRIITMQPDQKIIDSKLLKYMLLSAPLQEKIFARATGATVLGIKARWLKLIPISFPKAISTQKCIALELDALSEEVSRLQSNCRRKLAALDALKQSLLHHAFNGEL